MASLLTLCRERKPALEALENVALPKGSGRLVEPDATMNADVSTSAAEQLARRAPGAPDGDAMATAGRRSDGDLEI
jgi:hypothetical protein